MANYWNLITNHGKHYATLNTRGGPFPLYLPPMNPQWTYGPTLMTWRYDLHIAFRSF